MYGQSYPIIYEDQRCCGFNQPNPAAMRYYWTARQFSNGENRFNRGPAQGRSRQPEARGQPSASWGGARKQQRQSHANVRSRQRAYSANAPGSGARGIVKEMLRRNPLLMVSFTYCPYCKKLAAALDEERIPFRKYDVDHLPNKNQIMDEFEKLSGIRTVPQMYVKERFIGDGSKTMRMIATGEFHSLIGRRKKTNVRNAPDLVDDVLERYPVVMMSFSYCPHCVRLAQKLDDAGIYYYKFEVDKLPNRNEVIDEFEMLSGIRTAPQMFVAGKFVGDGSSTREMIASGELQCLIRAAVG